MSRFNRLRTRVFAESLEGRLMLAADPVITELMARNDDFLRDSYGRTSDWLEIHNPADETIDLTGWFLSDDEDRLNRWQFPSTTIEPNGYLVVFASGDDTPVGAEGQLYTNFALGGDGEFLALVKPDGQTIVSQYAPEYPEQFDDISYGIEYEAQAETVLVSPQSDAKWHVPQSAQATWNQPSFADESWRSVKAGIGFDEVDNVGLPTNLKTYFSFDNSSGTQVTDRVTATEHAVVGEAGSIVEGQFGAALQLNGDSSIDLEADNDSLRSGFSLAAWIYPTENNRTIISSHSSNLSGGFWFGYNSGGPWLGIAAGASEADGSTGSWTNVSAAGTMSTLNRWYHVVATFDPSRTDGEVRFFIDGVEVAADEVSGRNVTNGSMGDAGDALLRIGRHNAGSFPFAGSLDDVAVFDEPLTPTQVSLLVTEGVAPDLSYANEIVTDVADDLSQTSSTGWLRIPFSGVDVEGLNNLALNVQFDDGFIAYLNGVEIASANAPDSPTWLSTATDIRDRPDALAVESFDVTHAIEQLRADENLLAVQVLNANALDDELLFVPELVVSRTATRTRYFPEPTPGAENGNGVDGFVERVSMDVERGYFEQPFSLTIATATPGSQIRYTTDGSAPTATNGWDYTGPITIDETTTLRASAFRTDYLAAPVVTQSYVFPENVIQQTNQPPGTPDTWGVYRIGRTGQPVPADYEMNPTVVDRHRDTLIDDLKAIPTLSIVMDPADLYGNDQKPGIYTDAFMEDPIRERATSIEWFQADGARELQIDAGIRVFGGWSRHFWATPKKSFALKFKRPYGPTKLEFPLFADNQVDSQIEPTDEFDTVLLRAVFSDAWPDGASPPQYLRDLNARYTQLAMGQPSSHGTWVHLYLNGVYWGIYNPSERPDASFMASYYGGDKEEYDVVKHQGLCGPGCAVNDNFEVVDGGEAASDAYQELLQLARRGLQDDHNYQQFKQWVDVENLIDYILLNHYIGNVDWPHKNWYAARQREGTEGWKFFAWDSEYTLRGVSDSRVAANSPANRNTPAELFDAARENQEFLDLFADRVQKHMFNEGALQPEANIARYQSLAEQIEGAVKAEAARWGDNNATRQGTTNYTFSRWESVKNSILNSYFPRRHEIAIRQLRSARLYPSIDAPSFSQFGGEVESGTPIEVTASEGIIYYTTDGRDPRGEDRQPQGVRYTSPIQLLEPGSINARVFHDGEWSALTVAAYDVVGGQFIVLQDGMNPDPSYDGTVDTVLREQQPSIAHGNQTTVAVSAAAEDPSLGLLRWQIPADQSGRIVEGATLTLDVQQPTDSQFELFAVNRAWSTQATWNNSGSGVWQVAGASGPLDRGLPTQQIELIDADSEGRFYIPSASVNGWQAREFDDSRWMPAANGLGYEVEGEALLPGLVGAFSYASNDGAVNAATGTAAEIIGTANYGEGQYGDGFVFDGDTHLAFSASEVTGTGPLRDGFTLATWLRPTADDRTLLSQVNLGRPDRGFWFGYNQGGPWLGIAAGATDQAGATGSWTNVSAPGLIEQLDRWYHLAVVFDPSETDQEVRFYLDGQPVTSGVENANLPDGWMGDSSDIELRIGRHNAGAFPFEGTLDETLILDRPVSAAQIKILHEQPGTAVSGTSLQGAINTDVSASMQGVNASAYQRMHFNIEEAAAIDALHLDLRYDDGFVAYLNGSEVARRNVVGEPEWNQTATQPQDPLQLVEFETIDVSSFRSLLNDGNNVLAIQLANITADDNDAFLDVRLRGTIDAEGHLGTLTVSDTGLASTRLNETGIELVQRWLDDPESNFGLALAATDSNAAPLVFHSSEAAEPTQRPRLLLRFRDESIEGDFNLDGILTADDIDALCAAIGSGEHPSRFDLTDDGLVDNDDRDRMVREVMGTVYGDVDLNGVFDSSDLVAVFQLGHYEDDLVGNSSWASGDWNCDGEFTTADLVLAFQ